MVDDHDLEGLDPYDLMATEGARLDSCFSDLSGSQWTAPSRCEGWSVRDVLAHLTASESYNRACLDGTVQQLFAEMATKGATDFTTFNEVGIRELDAMPTDELLALWRAQSSANREDFRARDGDNVDSSVGAYPARWQAFHLAFELAIHADDVHVPVTAAEASDRTAWEARFGRFALRETKPGIDIEGVGGQTHVHLDDIDIHLPDAEFVQAVAARLPDDSALDAATAAVLSATP